jgi:hypothetical protein
MKEAVLSRVKKLLFAAVLMFGVVGAAAPANAVVIHEEVTIDTDQITPSDPPGPGEGAVLSLCLILFGNPPACIVI